MSLWPQKSLGEVTVIERDSVQPENIKTGTSYIGLEHIESGGKILSVPEVSNGDLASSKFHFTKKHILYGKLRPYLAKIACPDFDGICSTDILPILPNDDMEKRYICYFLRQPDIVALANSKSSGANLPRLSPTSLSEITLPVPPLAEQKRIAEILDQAEALRAKRRTALALLDELTQSIFLDMFGDPVTNPKGWPTEVIGSLDLQIADGNYSSKYPTNAEFIDAGIPFIRANNMRDMTVIHDDMRFISVEKHKELRKGHLQVGDVLITTRGEIGNVAIVPPAFADANINAQIVLLRATSDQLNQRFLAHQLAMPQLKLRMQSFQSGVALKQLPIRQLVRIPILVPTRDLQKEFSELTEGIDEMRSHFRCTEFALDQLFAALQHRAFQGEL